MSIWVNGFTMSNNVNIFHCTCLLDDCLVHLLLFRLSFHGMIKDSVMLFVLIFSKTARSIIDLAIWPEVFSECRKSLVLMWRIILSGFTSLIVCLSWSYMHCTFGELNGWTFTMHLWSIAFIMRKSFRFFTVMSLRMRQMFYCY